MKLVMTLLVRDESDIVDAQIAFHLNAGVDFVVATDNASADGTTEILRSYERDGFLHLIHEPGPDMRQEEWVTRMARLAAVEFGADWVINSDADEFWWPRARSLKDVLSVIPDRYGIVSCLMRNFAPRPDDGEFFAERMSVRLSAEAPEVHDASPFHKNQKVAHRGDPHVTVTWGNHDVASDTLLRLRLWYPIEVLHFPVRTMEQCRQKFVTAWDAWTRNPARAPAPHQARAFEADRAGTFPEYYASLVVDDDGLTRHLAQRTAEIDTRLRDALRSLRAHRSAHRQFRLPADGRTALTLPEPDWPDAGYVRDVASLAESDGSIKINRQMEQLERRLARLERVPGARWRIRRRVARVLGSATT